MRMRELAEAAGLPRTTIHHYQREGLLPEPNRTAANAATYGPEHLERLALLKALRGPELGPLPVQEIRRVLELVELGLSPAEAVELRALGRRGASGSRAIGTEEDGEVPGRLSLRDLGRMTGRDTRELRQLMAAGLLTPTRSSGADGFDTVDVAAVNSCATLLDSGLSPTDLKPLADLLREVSGFERVLEDVAASTMPDAETDSLRAELKGAFRDLRVYLLARAEAD